MSLSYNKIAIGDVFSFQHTFTNESEKLFGDLTGDKTEGPNGSVHGMLAASLFSTLIDTYGPGPESIYVTQTLQFRKPVPYNEVLTVKGIVLDKSDGTHIIKLKTEILLSGTTLVSGEAQIII